MVRTGVIRSTRSQAVRLPKAVAFPDEVKEVIVLRDGKRRVLVPSDAAWDDFFDLPGIDLRERAQPVVAEREAV
jgi:antitoxin VapB